MKDKEMYYDNFSHTENEGRYINYSSVYPNCKGVVYYDKDDGNKVHILMVTTVDIQTYTQITISYGKEFKNRKECVASCEECNGAPDAANHTKGEEEIIEASNTDEDAAKGTTDDEAEVQESNSEPAEAKPTPGEDAE